MRRPLLHWLLLGGLVVMWGSAFAFIKIALRAFSPHGLVAARLVIAAAVLVAVVVATRRAVPLSRRHAAFWLAMAVSGNVVPFWLIAWGQQRIDSGLAGILMAVMPLATILLAHVAVAGERLDRFKVAGFVLGFLGVVVLIGPDALLELRGHGTALVSQLAVLGGAICYAINAVIARRRPPGDSLTVSAAVMVVAAVLVTAATPVAGPIVVAEVTPLAASAVAFLGLIATALATIVFFKLITAAGPSFMSLTNYLIPPWAVIAGFLFLHERPGWSALLAMAMILLGILVAERRIVGGHAPAVRTPG